MKVDDIHINGLGVYLPDLVTVQQAIDEGLCDPETAGVGWISTRVAGDMPAPDMAVKATAMAMQRSRLDNGHVDLLVHTCVSHQGPDGWSPHHYVQRHTIGGSAQVIGLSQGCNGMLAALELAIPYLQALPERTAAVITAADNFGTELLNRWRAHRAVVYGDVGSAMVVSKRPGFARVLAINSVSLPEMEELGRGTEPLFPPGATVGRPLSFEERMAGYHDELLLKARELVADANTEVVHRTIKEAGVELDDVVRVAHQATGSATFIQVLFNPLGIDASRGVVQFGCENGRTGASDQVASFNDMVEKGELRPGDHLMLLGGGPGMSITCVVVQMVEQPSWAA